MTASLRLGLVVLASGCAEPEVLLRFEKPWSEAATGVAVGSISDGSTLPGTPVVVSAGRPVTLTLTSPPPFRLVLVEERPEESAALEQCGVREGGDRSALPTPASIWSAEVDPDAADQTSLMPIDAVGVDLRYERCEPPTACDRITAIQHDLPFTGFNTAFIQWTPGDRFVVVLGTPSSTVGPTRLAVVSAIGEVEELGGPVDDVAAGLAWDGADRVYLSYTKGRVDRIELSDPPQLIAMVDAGGGRLSGRPDGLVILYAGGAPFVLAQPRVGHVDPSELPDGMLLLSMPGIDVMAAIVGRDVLLYDAVARRWGSDFALPSVPSGTTLVHDSVTWSVVSPSFAYRLEAGDWRLLPTPPPPLAVVRAAARLESGVLLLGDVGGAALWLDDRWCGLETPGVFNALRAASTSDDGSLVGVGIDPSTVRAGPKLLLWRSSAR